MFLPRENAAGLSRFRQQPWPRLPLPPKVAISREPCKLVSTLIGKSPLLLIHIVLSSLPERHADVLAHILSTHAV